MSLAPALEPAQQASSPAESVPKPSAGTLLAWHPSCRRAQVRPEPASRPQESRRSPRWLRRSCHAGPVFLSPFHPIFGGGREEQEVARVSSARALSRYERG